MFSNVKQRLIRFTLAARTYSIQQRGVSHVPLSSPDQLQGRLFQDDDIFTHPCIYLHPPLLYSSPTPAFVLLSAATLAPCWLAMWYWPRRNLGRKTCFRFWRKIDNVFLKIPRILVCTYNDTNLNVKHLYKKILICTCLEAPFLNCLQLHSRPKSITYWS